jgi:predicted transcriptional regulator
MAIIAAFIFMGAGGEQQMVRLQHSIAGVTVAQVMSQRVLTLHPFDALQRAIEYFYQSTQQDFPVVENERLVGMMQKEDIQNAMRLGRNTELVAAMMRTRFTAVQPQAVLEKVYAEMAARNLTAVPVVENGRFAGLLTLENIGRYMIVAAAVEEQLGKQRE